MVAVGYGGEGGYEDEGNSAGEGMLYKSVVQLVLLYWSESWVVTGSMLKLLEGFHHRVVRSIMGITERRIMIGE